MVSKDILLSKLRSGAELTFREQLSLTFILAVPAILAQLSMCLMSYIDAAMVGRLGSAQAAAIGLVSSTGWLFGSFCYSTSSGFSVQVAHKCGAKDFEGARQVFRTGLLAVIAASAFLCAVAASISGAVPVWLGGTPEVNADASRYFLVYALFLPVFQISVFAEAVLVASGNIKVPSLTSMAMCVMDVVFNYLFIFVMDMGVVGAALGTGLSEVIAGGFLLYYVFHSSPELKQRIGGFALMRRFPGNRAPSTYKVEMKEGRTIVGRAFKISWPLWLQNIVSRGAYIAATVLVAPLGTVAIAANSFAIIAEGFCYLPGYGMQDAATTLVGQSLGARRKALARRFAWITIWSGALMMTALAVLMWIFAPQIMALLSPDQAVVELGVKCLRIEAWAEFFFGVGIVASGCCVGAGDTLASSGINLLSMWVVRICLAMILIPEFGLVGYWIAMAVELTVKGIIFAVRIGGNRWLKTKIFENENNI